MSTPIKYYEAAITAIDLRTPGYILVDAAVLHDDDGKRWNEPISLILPDIAHGQIREAVVSNDFLHLSERQVIAGRERRVLEMAAKKA